MAYSLPAASSSAISHSPTDNEVESNRPSTSAAAQTSSHYYCQIFINHRGPDVKKTLASLLHRRLTSEGLTVFLDQPELLRGGNITSQIESAIRTAHVHVAIFSPRYAESKWCLEELVLMRESRGVIIPVFYNVKPSDLKWANGLYAEALRQLENKKPSEEKPRYDPATIDKWRNALVHVAEISGFELEACDGDEGELLEKVVERVKMVMVNKTSFEVAKYTGVDENVKDFENTVLLQEQQSGKPQVVRLVGWGGVGKTTLAKELFNRKRPHYTRSCLLSNVKECRNEDSLNSLKKKLFQNLTGSHGTLNIDEDIKSLENHAKFKAFVILDDVDDVKQVYAVLAFDTVLSSDSLILITSRDRGVLPRSRENLSIYPLSGFNPLQSRELFCSHAFSQPHPNPGFESLVEEFLKVCDGLPLNLKVFGSCLCGNNEKKTWEDKLERLQKIPPREIRETFRISYDGLEIDEKEMFLDIANFFIGEKREMAIRIWDGSGWKGSLGFQNLENKSFVEVDSEDEIKMRDHIRDMGRKFVEDEKLPRRFWHWTENSDDMLHQLSNEQVITKVQRRTGVRTVIMQPWRIMTGVRTARDHESWYKRSRIGLLGKPHNGVPNTNLQLLDVEDGYLERILKRLQSPEDLIWLRWRNCSRSSLPSWLP